MSVSIDSLNERELVDRLRDRVGAPPAWVTLGIGDDAAVLRPARNMAEVVTTDSLVEGVHFRRDWSSAASIGHKALAVNLSDLAAMGARPRASLLSLALPGTLPLADFDAMIGGYLTLAASAGAPLVGGNMTRSPGPLVVDVTAIGSVGHRRVLQRTGARPGDQLFVTGTIGAAAAGLAMLEAGVDRGSLTPAMTDCLDHYERPTPRLRCGGIVGRSRAAAAAIDLSDGLADAATRLAEGGRVGVVLDGATLPIHPGVLEWTARAGVDPVLLALVGGEDYELAFAVTGRQRSRFRSATKRCPDLPITRIGTFVKEPGAWLEREGRREPLPGGFSHF
jgi:thiamine-monophosphate kinase